MKRFLKKRTVLFNRYGSFDRLGDYMGGNQLDLLPFSFDAEGVFRFSEPRFQGSGACRTLLFTDEARQVQISCHLELDTENNILLRRDTVTNLTDAPLVRRRSLARFPLTQGEYELHSTKSFWCGEDQGSWEKISSGSRTLTAREGRFCEGSTPWAVIRDRYASHALGFMVMPEGDWVLRFTAASRNGMLNDLTVEAGLSDDRLALEIAPRSSWEAPAATVQLLPAREHFSGSAQMNRFLNRLFPPRPGHQRIVYNTWLDRMNALSLPRLRRQLAAAKECGCELFVVDYGWYDDKKTFTRLNNWEEHTEKAFKGNMQAFADEVRQAGLGFGFWVEMEFFADASDIVKERPHWFLPSAHPKIVYPKLWLPEVEDYMVSTLAETVRRYQAVYIKNDMNHSQGHENSSLNLYYAGLKRVMARLKALCPQVTFENCSSGALRMAAGPMLESFDTHFISDNGSPLDNLRMLQETTCRFPPGRIYHWYVGCQLHPGEESSFRENSVMQVQGATWYRSQMEDLHFGLLCSLTGILGFSCDLASFSSENRAVIARYTAFYKAHREQLLRGELHLLTPPETFETKRGYLAFQLSDPVTDTHFLFVFHSLCDGDSRRIFHPCALKGGSYTVEKCFPETAAVMEEVSGKQLHSEGLCVSFDYDQLEGFRGQLFMITPQGKGQ